MANPNGSPARTPGVRSAIPQRGTTAGAAAVPTTTGSPIAPPSVSTPTPASRLRARPPAISPAVPARWSAGAMSPSVSASSAPAPKSAGTTPSAASGFPRTRKMSIPRLGTTASASGSPSQHVPPLPSTPRKPRLSSGLERVEPAKSTAPKTPTTPASTAAAASRQTRATPPLPLSHSHESPELAALGRAKAGISEAESRAPLMAVQEAEAHDERGDKNPSRRESNANSTEKVNTNGEGNGSKSGNGSRSGDGNGHPHGQIPDQHTQRHEYQRVQHETTSSPPPPTIVRDDALEIAQKRAHDLEIQYRLLQAEHSRCNPRLERPMRALRSEGNSAGMEDKLVALLLDRETLGTVVRSLPKDQRMGLLGVIAEACKPADIQAQIEMLEKYKEMRTGVLARLDDDLCHRVLFFLNRQELLQLRLVSKRFDVLATSPKVWKPLCRELETRWDGTIDLTNYHLGDDGDWFGLFKSLWQREKHWTNGEAQSLALLSGHKNYVTSLKLCGETLISASYDDTIRIWHLPYFLSGATSVPPPTVVPAKSVSSLDYYAPEGVLVTGSHDIGRASVWRQFDGEWKVERILSGHLHGTRAVAINAQWLVSVGSDKAIVVWDWRTGTKIVRFGQQTNVCVGMNLLDNFIISATVDGVIRTFSIAKREMLGQFKLSDMAARHPEVAEKLREVGVGALGMLNWFTAEGRFLACATKDIVIRLAWDWADPEEQAELAEGIDSPTKSTFHDPHLQTSPITPTVTRTRQSLGGRGTASSPRPASPRSPRTPQSGAATPQRVPSSSVPQVTSKMAYNVTADSEDLHETSTTTNTTSKFALGRYPMVVEVLDITGTERGAFEAGRVRIVTSRRLSSRAGAERRVLVGTEHLSPDGSKANMVLVPLGGKWDTVGRQVGLQGPTKNPMSLALDHDKLVYGCTDGSIVVAGFVATQSQLRKKQPRRSSPVK